MAAHRSMASLSQTLLARKGQARPAMRPSGLGGYASLASAGDDLGWNDMGEDPAPPPPPALPPVLVDRRRLSEHLVPSAAEVPLPLEPEPEPEPMPVAVAPRAPAPKMASDTRRAAFTLRLDAERHLCLRLASAAGGRSSQKLVTEALDAFLATLPEVAALRAQLAGGDTRNANLPKDRGE